MDHEETMRSSAHYYRLVLRPLRNATCGGTTSTARIKPSAPIALRRRFFASAPLSSSSTSSFSEPSSTTSLGLLRLFKDEERDLLEDQRKLKEQSVSWMDSVTRSLWFCRPFDERFSLLTLFLNLLWPLPFVVNLAPRGTTSRSLEQHDVLVQER